MENHSQFPAFFRSQAEEPGAALKRVSFDCRHGLSVTLDSCNAAIGANALLGRAEMTVM